MPDPSPRTPFDAVTDPEPPETTPHRPASTPPGPEEYASQIKETADKLLRDQASRGDVKLLSTADPELRYCFKVFAAYRGQPQGDGVRLGPHAARPPGVRGGRGVRPAHGRERLHGHHRGRQRHHGGRPRRRRPREQHRRQILLPFEQDANPIIHGDPKLMHLKYFFTRKLLFVKESDAVALFPGGFGTQDEGFEVLTLVQTGKSHIFPIVMVDEPGGDYWKLWQRFIDDVLLPAADLAGRHVSVQGDRLGGGGRRGGDGLLPRLPQHALRPRRPGAAAAQSAERPFLEQIERGFGDILAGGTFEQVEALPAEANEPELAELPRLKFRFDRQAWAGCGN